MKKLMISFIALSFLLSATAADLRIWEDSAGTQYNATFVRELFGKVTLKCDDGREIRIPEEDFSEHDQRYMRVSVPPAVVIDFSKTEWVKPRAREMFSIADRELMHKAKVTIVKDTKRIFTSRLYASLYMVAAEVDGDNFILLSKTDSSFLLGDHNDNTHVFSSEPDKTRAYDEQGPSGWRGEDYAGYLVVVSDKDGNIIETKTDVPGRWIDDPEVIKNLDELAVRGAASIRSRHFDKTGKKSILTRPKPRPFSETNHSLFS